VDQGYCFNAADWTFSDSALRGVYSHNCVYASVCGWESFEPALTRAEEMDISELWGCAKDIPEEWYERDTVGLDRLVNGLYARRRSIRNLITAFRKSSREPFPNWRGNA
jgi:hypothetical protein